MSDNTKITYDLEKVSTQEIPANLDGTWWLLTENRFQTLLFVVEGTLVDIRTGQVWTSMDPRDWITLQQAKKSEVLLRVRANIQVERYTENA